MKKIRITGIVGNKYKIPNGAPNNSHEVQKTFCIKNYEILGKKLIIEPEKFNNTELIKFLSDFGSQNVYSIKFEDIFTIETCICERDENGFLYFDIINVTKLKK